MKALTALLALVLLGCTPGKPSREALAAKELKRAVDDYTYEVLTGPEFVHTVDSLGMVYDYPWSIYPRLEDPSLNDRIREKESNDTWGAFLAVRRTWCEINAEREKQEYLKRRNN